jgi:hypothetical protein
MTNGTAVADEPITEDQPPQSALDLAMQIVKHEMERSPFSVQSAIRHGEPGMDRAVIALMCSELHIIRMLLEELVEQTRDE